MEYIFGKNDCDGAEELKTVGKAHTVFEGFQETVREYPDCTITDSFRIVRKTKSDEDAEGICYDWYVIDHHSRIIDKTPMLAARLDYLSMMTGVELPEEGGAEDGAQSEI